MFTMVLSTCFEHKGAMCRLDQWVISLSLLFFSKLQKFDL